MVETLQAFATPGRLFPTFPQAFPGSLGNCGNAKVTKKKPKPQNPWGLSARQEALMRELARCGSDTEAASAAGVPPDTFQYHMREVRRKMGAANRVLAVLAWDRYARGLA